VQSQLAYSTDFTSTQTVLLPLPVTSGHTIVVAVSAYASAGVANVAGVTDSAANTYTRVVQEPASASGNHNLSLWVATGVKNTVGLSVTVHAPASLGEYLDVAVHEYSTGTVDQSAHTSGSGTDATSGAITTSAAGDLIFGAFLHQAPSADSPTSATPGSGFNLRQAEYDGNYEPLVTEDGTTGPVSSYHAGLTWNKSADWYGVGLTLKP
jgi:hypothetical protein